MRLLRLALRLKVSRADRYISKTSILKLDLRSASFATLKISDIPCEVVFKDYNFF